MLCSKVFDFDSFLKLNKDTTSWYIRQKTPTAGPLHKNHNICYSDEDPYPLIPAMENFGILSHDQDKVQGHRTCYTVKMNTIYLIKKMWQQITSNIIN